MCACKFQDLLNAVPTNFFACASITHKPCAIPCNSHSIMQGPLHESLHGCLYANSLQQCPSYRSKVPDRLTRNVRNVTNRCQYPLRRHMVGRYAVVARVDGLARAMTRNVKHSV